MSDRMTPELVAALAHAIEVFEAQHGHYDAWTAEERQAHDVLIARVRADHGARGGLTPGQLAGLDCIHCGREATPGVPVGHIDGGQVFSCLPCHSPDAGPACAHCGGRERLLLSLGDGRVACVPVCPPQYRDGAR